MFHRDRVIGKMKFLMQSMRTDLSRSSRTPIDSSTFIGSQVILLFPSHCWHQVANSEWYLCLFSFQVNAGKLIKLIRFCQITWQSIALLRWFRTSIVNQSKGNTRFSMIHRENFWLIYRLKWETVSAGWQIKLCDPVWHEISQSDEVLFVVLASASYTPFHDV